MDEPEDFQEDVYVTVKVGEAGVLVPLIDRGDVTPPAVPGNLEFYGEAPILKKEDDKPVDPYESRSGGILELPSEPYGKCRRS